jgi:hypothetical protein
VVALGLTAKWKAPVFAAGTIDLSCFHGCPLLRACTTTSRTPRTMPLSRILVPAATGGFGVGG